MTESGRPRPNPFTTWVLPLLGLIAIGFLISWQYAVVFGLVAAVVIGGLGLVGRSVERRRRP